VSPPTASHQVYILAAKDRFADYGLVGVLIYAGNHIDTFVLSCRVIGQRRLPLSAEIVNTTRNEPFRNVFRDAGFTECGGAYELRDSHQLTEPPPGVFQIIE
jgi:predicted enzyme involved in methoxymalonyl-ACP biosynthesis